MALLCRSFDLKVKLLYPLIKELSQGFVDTNSERCDIDIKDSVTIYNGDVIFSWSATLLVKIWTGGNGGLNQHLFKVTSDEYPKWFYYYWTKNI